MPPATFCLMNARSARLCNNPGWTNAWPCANVLLTDIPSSLVLAAPTVRQEQNNKATTSTVIANNRLFITISFLCFLSFPPPGHQDTKTQLYFSTFIFLCAFVSSWLFLLPLAITSGELGRSFSISGETGDEAATLAQLNRQRITALQCCVLNFYRSPHVFLL